MEKCGRRSGWGRLCFPGMPSTTAERWGVRNERQHMWRTSIANIERGGQTMLVHQLLNIARALKVQSVSLRPKASLISKHIISHQV
jgi:hypothetical protein